MAHAESTSTVAASKLSAAEDRFGEMLTVVSSARQSNLYCWVVLGAVLV